MKKVKKVVTSIGSWLPKLSAEARGLWSALKGEYQIKDAAGMALLTRMAEALDRMRQAQKDIAENGLLIPDQKGSKKMNPACQVEKEAHRQMLEALRMLRLDIEPKVK